MPASKHPERRTLEASSLKKRNDAPNFADTCVADETVKKVARCPTGGAGVLGGSDSHALQRWLLRFGAASRKLHSVTAKFVDWLSNSFLR